ncbi:MAG: hypothetical protein Q7R70_05690 [Candidatus Diapherotrites archaeon]|nr:hypothetical protein [Candidatus Diapherotrites archaeon]
MPSKQNAKSQEHNIGQLYSQITVDSDLFSNPAEKKLEKRKFHPFVAFCKKIYKMSPGLGGKGAKFNEEFGEAVDFLGWRLQPEDMNADWNLRPEELNAAATFSMIVAGIVFVGLGFLTMFLIGDYLNNVLGPLSYLYIFAPAILAALLITYFVQNFPLEEAKTEQVKALTFVPEIMGYLIMSMKLVPNLEKAVEFAAEHGHGKICDDFKVLLWDLELGNFNTLSEGLDELALRWGKYSTEFKESLMMVRASVLEDTEAKRYAMLDKTMTNLLESVKTKMEQYARDLSQPSISLFYLGVLLPLILIIILPVGSAFSGQPLARTELLIFVYNIVIPIMALVFALNVIKKRPPTYEPPKIPDNHPLLPPKWQMEFGGLKADLRAVIALVLIVGFGLSLFLHFFGLGIPSIDGTAASLCIMPGLEKSGPCFLADKTPEFALKKSGNKPANYFSVEEPAVEGTLYAKYRQTSEDTELARALVLKEQFKFFSQPSNDTSPQTLVFGILLTLSLCLFIFFYYSNIYKRKIQLDAIRIESEFKEALYILASRMGENKPIEDAMKHVRDFLPKYKVSTEVFGRTVHNIEVMGMPLNEAFFDQTYGSLKDNPSSMVKSAIRLVVDSVQLGVEVASRTIASLSMQLANQDKVNQNLKVLVSDVSQMMRLMSTMVGPAILGVTVSLQKIVMSTLANVVSVNPTTNTPDILNSDLGSLANISQSFAISPDTMQALVTPTMFLLIVAVYVIEIVIVLMYFTSKIEEDNDVAAQIIIAKSLPVAVVVFLISAIVSSMVVGNMSFG